MVVCGTCPQYLQPYRRKFSRNRTAGQIGPPLRYERDRMALCRRFKMEPSTPSRATTPKARDDRPLFRGSFGSPSAETMLTVAYDEGVNTGRIGSAKLVQLLSENPAKISVNIPQKGILQEGADADVVVFDPVLRPHDRTPDPAFRRSLHII